MAYKVKSIVITQARQLHPNVLPAPPLLHDHSPEYKTFWVQPGQMTTLVMAQQILTTVAAPQFHILLSQIYHHWIM